MNNEIIQDPVQYYRNFYSCNLNYRLSDQNLEYLELTFENVVGFHPNFEVLWL